MPDNTSFVFKQFADCHVHKKKIAVDFNVADYVNIYITKSYLSNVSPAIDATNVIYIKVILFFISLYLISLLI